MHEILDRFLTVIITVLIVLVVIDPFVEFKMPNFLRKAYKDRHSCVQTSETPSPVRSSSRLAVTSYTFIMKDGTTNVVDLTQVKEMTTNLDLIKEENHDN